MTHTINMNMFSRINIDDVPKSLVSCRLRITPMGICGIRTVRPNRRHQCDTGQQPSKSQVNQ